MTALPNDPANRCVGCGPANPAGLQLEFHRDGDRVHATLVAGPNHEGWPERMHSAILYMALIETMNWTLYGVTGRIGLPTRTGALQTRAMVRTGDTLTLAGRLTDRSDEDASAVAAATRNGEVVARLERDYALVSRAEFLTRMGYDEVPAGLEDALPPP